MANSLSSWGLLVAANQRSLRMVAGLEEISGGEISIGNRVVNDLEPAERDIAMVFQNYALYPHMSVFDNMAYGLKSPKYPKTKSKPVSIKLPKF
jgi:sn-glycerol 3-phosphate transport system ATP-binding protein